MIDMMPKRVEVYWVKYVLRGKDRFKSCTDNAFFNVLLYFI